MVSLILLSHFVRKCLVLEVIFQIARYRFRTNGHVRYVRTYLSAQVITVILSVEIRLTWCWQIAANLLTSKTSTCRWSFTIFFFFFATLKNIHHPTPEIGTEVWSWYGYLSFQITLWQKLYVSMFGSLQRLKICREHKICWLWLTNIYYYHIIFNI